MNDEMMALAVGVSRRRSQVGEKTVRRKREYMLTNHNKSEKKTRFIY